MANLTLQLISNANQAQQGLVKLVLPHTGIFTTLSEKAKSKLKLKRKPTTCYLEGGTIIDRTTGDSDIIALFQNLQDENATKPIKLYFSDDEVYAGPPPSSRTARDVKGKYRVIASEALVDQEAYKQLKDTLKLEGMLLAVGMPDLHPSNRCKSVVYERCLCKLIMPISKHSSDRSDFHIG
jgi:hypothetical protein